MRKKMFLLEDKGHTALFAPLIGLIIEVGKEEKQAVAQLVNNPNTSVADLMELFPEIDPTQLLDTTIDCATGPIMETFYPTSATLFPTFDCNLRCIYCYAHAGERAINMSWEIAKATIDLIIRNARASGILESSLRFHGGGEPTWNWDVFRHAVEYFLSETKRYGIKPDIGLATNGILSEDQIAWIAQHLEAVQVSIDGEHDLHNMQRPFNETYGSGDSFATVCSTISSLLKRDIAVTLHCVIMDNGIDVMPRITEFFTNSFPGAAIHFEPVCECGRGMNLKQEFAFQASFAEGFSISEQIAAAAGSEVFYSGIGFDIADLREGFCGVSNPNFTVTPEGLITACHEAGELSHPNAQRFIYGHFDTHSTQFVFDHKKIRWLRNRGDESSTRCRNCFAQYHCGGECLSKRLQITTETEELLIGERCKINRELLRRRIFQKLLTEEKGDFA